MLPTANNLARFIGSVDDMCLPCGSENEILDYLFIHCPFTIALWLNSKWQLRIDRIHLRNISVWITDLYSNSSQCVIPMDIRHECLNFAVVGMEWT